MQLDTTAFRQGPLGNNILSIVKEIKGSGRRDAINKFIEVSNWFQFISVHLSSFDTLTSHG